MIKVENNSLERICVINLNHYNILFMSTSISYIKVGHNFSEIKYTTLLIRAEVKKEREKRGKRSWVCSPAQTHITIDLLVKITCSVKKFNIKSS